MASTKMIPTELQKELFQILKDRFEKNIHRHQGIQWESILEKLELHPEKVWSINEMEETGGEPDVIGLDKEKGSYLICDCAAESPKGTRSICYDPATLLSRKENKPKNNAIGMAAAMGIEILTEPQYIALQELENFDTKTSSWVQTPEELRKLGGAIFGDCRYERVFIYHNGAESYYASRGFRGMLIL